MNDAVNVVAVAVILVPMVMIRVGLAAAMLVVIVGRRRVVSPPRGAATSWAHSAVGEGPAMVALVMEATFATKIDK